MPADDAKRQGIFAELKTVVRRAGEVWHRVSKRRRRTFMFAGSLMLIGAAANTLVMLWLGGLVDAMEGKRSPDWFSRAPLYAAGLAEKFDWAEIQSSPAADEAPLPKPPQDLMVWIAVAFLSSIAVAYLIREALQVVRRCLIE